MPPTKKKTQFEFLVGFGVFWLVCLLFIWFSFLFVFFLTHSLQAERTALSELLTASLCLVNSDIMNLFQAFNLLIAREVLSVLRFKTLWDKDWLFYIELFGDLMYFQFTISY